MSDDNEAIGEHLIGMPIDKARDLYAQSGWIIRCVVADGKARVVCRGVSFANRINVETEKGVITKVRSHEVTDGRRREPPLCRGKGTRRP